MAEPRNRERTVWFYRNYKHINGANLKHSHYFDHVQQTPGFSREITFGKGTPDDLLCQRWELWPSDGAARWAPGSCDVLFLDGVEDWRYLAECGLESLPNPRINLIQGFLNYYNAPECHRYLAEKAIWICVSQQVADEISATGRTTGPILTIPNGTELTPAEAAMPWSQRSRRIQIVGFKQPKLANALSLRLKKENIQYHPPMEIFRKRHSFLSRLADSRVAVCLPCEKEGFYLVALEAMAKGCLVVTLDCIGNRGFCRHGVNCLIAEPDLESLYCAVRKALDMPGPERERLLRGARDTVAMHSLEAERERFQEILSDIDRLWRMDG